jgi:protein-S-isoprenylcysteine O-methyltransferase Ste14
LYQSTLWIILAVVLYGLVHSALASLEIKARARSAFGPEADRWYRLAYNLFAVVSLLPVLALTALLPDRLLYRVPAPWTALTLGLQVLAALALAAGLLQTGVLSFLGLRQVVAGDTASTRLVVNGLYRWVRHPLYTAGLALIWLVPAMTANLLALNLGLTFYLVIGAKFEERKLLRQFGQAYAQYLARTPMLVPSMRPLRQLLHRADSYPE